MFPSFEKRVSKCVVVLSPEAADFFTKKADLYAPMVMKSCVL